MSKLNERLQKARVSHLTWVARAEALVKGVPLEKEQVPLLATECGFGQWYHGEGRVLRALPSYVALEKPHHDLHHIYMEIFKLLYGKQERSLLSKLFGSKRALKQEAVEKATALLPELKKSSQLVLEGLDKLEFDIQQVRKRKLSQHKQPNSSDESLAKLNKELTELGYG
ncbi:MAG: hypothetical protein COB41_10345 [Proteobacteria bacterium]|nr:MAG: hypothetical protein COB41_10345 [Pseudomonadota bacterium]